MIMPGALKCIANLAIEKKKMETIGTAALIKWCYEVLRVSQMDYCPVDTGTLRRSGRVQILKSTMSETKIRISYTAEYALEVHELNRPHNVGSMKYLSTPFNLMSYRLMKQLEADMGAAA
jgi:hypothetical protein